MLRAPPRLTGTPASVVAAGAAAFAPDLEAAVAAAVAAAFAGGLYIVTMADISDDASSYSNCHWLLCSAAAAVAAVAAVVARMPAPVVSTSSAVTDYVPAALEVTSCGCSAPVHAAVVSAPVTAVRGPVRTPPGRPPQARDFVLGSRQS